MSDKNTSSQENELNPDNDEDCMLFQESAKELEKTHTKKRITGHRPDGSKIEVSVWSPKESS